MKKILLIRHGQSTLNVGPAVAATDSAEVPLKEEGVRKAEQAGCSMSVDVNSFA